MDHYIQTSHKMMLPATMQQGSWYQAMAKPSSESSRNTSRKCRPAGHDLSRHGHGQKAHEGFRPPKKKRGAEELRENRERNELESLGNKPVAMLVSSCGGRAGWMALWHCWMYFILYIYIYIWDPEALQPGISFCGCDMVWLHAQYVRISDYSQACFGQACPCADPVVARHMSQVALLSVGDAGCGWWPFSFHEKLP